MLRFIPLLFAFGLASLSASAALTVTATRCEGLVDPRGVDVAQPRLGWQLQSAERGERQTAYHVLVASSAQLLAGDTGDLWDSGRIESPDTLGVAYAGRALASSQQVFWKIRAYDAAGQPSPWSPPATWTVGILPANEGSGWQASTRWIGHDALLEPPPSTPSGAGAAKIAHPHANASLLLRREFTVRPGLRRALFHVSGLGHYELTANGTRSGDGLLTPGWTNYAKTCLYDTHDLTAQLRPGANALGLTLAGGMYNVQPGRYTKFTSAFRPLMAFGELHLQYDDGSTDIVGTDTQWRVSTEGPITFSNVYGGEDYDARREVATAGWDSGGFNDTSWSAAAETNGPGGTLRGVTHGSPPFRTFETFKPAATRELRPGVIVYDFGQNASMMPRLRVRGPAGSVVRMIPAELLHTDGSVNRASVGNALAYWQYTLRGPAAVNASGNTAAAAAPPQSTSAVENYFPKFFYHGARYLQVELLAAEAGGPLPTIDALESVVVHSDSAPAGDFACSNELFNRTRTLVRWAQRNNLAHVITDCPHRERLGWLEQYHLNGPSLRYEWDLTQLYKKCFADMVDAQTERGLVPDIAPEYVKFSGGFRDSPEWGSAIILAAWQHFVFAGDDRPLRDNYAAMQRYVAYLASMAKDGLVSHGLGDWYDIGPKPPGRSQLTPIPFTATAIYYEDLLTLSRIAAHLGHAGDSQRYRAEAATLADRFNREFFKSETGSYATGSQTAQALPLVLDLVAPAHRANVIDALLRDIRERGHAVTAGDVGYRYLLRALADAGRSDVIFAMNNQSEKPGYGYQLARGATSLTEAWDANPKSSQNHFMLGQIVEWFYHDLAGLQPVAEGEGFKRIRIEPTFVEGLDWARASYRSPLGPVKSHWRRDGKNVVVEISIPPGSTATVALAGAPDRKPQPDRAEHVKSAGMTNGVWIFEIGSGEYRFTTPAPQPPTAP